MRCKLKIKTVIEEILLDVAPKKRPSTQERYFMYLGEMLLDLGDFDINLFGRKDFNIWHRKLKLQKPHRKTFNDYVKFMNIVFNFAYQNKYITHLIKFPLVDGEQEHTGRVYSKKELNNIFLNMDEITKAQFILSLECFMRLREVLHLTWDRVDFEKKLIVLRKKDVKTGSRCGKGRDVPMSQNCFNVLLKLKINADTNFVFPSPNGKKYQNSNYKKWSRAKKDAKIVGRARWHDIRHTALTCAILELKLPIAHVSMVAGVSIRTLQKVYLHHEIEHLRGVAESMNLLKCA
jgi:integrase